MACAMSSSVLTEHMVEWLTIDDVCCCCCCCCCCRADFVPDLNIFKHEIGHNLGLPHSGRIVPPSDVQVSSRVTITESPRAGPYASYVHNSINACTPCREAASGHRDRIRPCRHKQSLVPPTKQCPSCLTLVERDGPSTCQGAGARQRPVATQLCPSAAVGVEASADTIAAYPYCLLLPVC